MHPEPIETPTALSDISVLEQPINASQHGFQSLEVEPAGSLNDSRSESTQALASSDATRTTIDRENGGQTLRRLNVVLSDENRSKPSVKRIAEHENAFAPVTPKKQAKGPLFRVVRKSSISVNGPQLEDFPNGIGATALTWRLLANFL
jgi:hypothetical protein